MDNHEHSSQRERERIIESDPLLTAWIRKAPHNQILDVRELGISCLRTSGAWLLAC